MASINTNVGGVDFAVTKQADGSYTISSESMPGSSYGPNNESVAGHWGTTLSPDKIASAINGTQNLIDSDNWNINDKLKQINDPNITDEAYKNTLRTQVAESQAQLEQHQAQLTAITSIQSQISSLTSQVDAADASSAPAGEAKTTAEASADATQSGVSNQEPGQPPAASQNTEESTTNSDPTQFQGESGNAPPDVPDPDTSALAALPTSAEDGYQIPPDTGGGNQDSQGGGGYESTGASTRASPDTVKSADKTPAQSKWSGPADLRVYIKVPSRFYANSPSAIKKAQGILFPYTPSISYDSQASYGSVNPLHSNYTQNFFKNSVIGNITITGKFTVQNEEEAEIWMALVELSRQLIKMPFGKDQNAGSAPPVCRLQGYGDWMFNNVPVAVTSFRFDLPEGVDYIVKSQNGYGSTMVPVVSNFNYSLIPMYSRQEIRDFSVDDWLGGKLKGKGYL
jgi:hypothetical protein